MELQNIAQLQAGGRNRETKKLGDEAKLGFGLFQSKLVSVDHNGLLTIYLLFFIGLEKSTSVIYLFGISVSMLNWTWQLKNTETFEE